MAQQTALQVTGLPGPPRVFLAKTAAPVGGPHDGEFTRLSVMAIPGPIRTFEAKGAAPIVVTETYTGGWEIPGLSADDIRRQREEMGIIPRRVRGKRRRRRREREAHLYATGRTDPVGRLLDAEQTKRAALEARIAVESSAPKLARLLEDLAATERRIADLGRQRDIIYVMTIMALME